MSWPVGRGLRTVYTRTRKTRKCAYTVQIALYMEDEKRGTKAGFRSVRVRGPGRRSSSNIRAILLIIGGVVALLCLMVLVLVVTVAVSVALSNKGTLKTLHKLCQYIFISPLISYRLRFYTRVLVRECSQQHGHFGRSLRRLLPV